MLTTFDIRTAVPSQVPDFRSVPLAQMASLSTVILEEALGRFMPNPQTAPAPVPVAAFSSAL